MTAFHQKPLFIILTITASAFLSTAPTVSFAQEFAKYRGDNTCADGYELATPTATRANVQQACRALDTWTIARLAGGGSMDGSGYNCKIRDSDTRSLGDTLCMRSTEPKFKVQAGDGQCPDNYVMASAHQVRDETENACAALGTWFIARLAGGGSMDGNGYNCKVRDTDNRGLGHSLCIKGNKEDYGHGTNCIADTLLPDTKDGGAGAGYAWLHGNTVQGKRYTADEAPDGYNNPALASQAAKSYCKSKRYDWFSAHNRSELPDPHLDVKCCSKLSTENSLVSPQLLAFTNSLATSPANADELSNTTDPDQLFHTARDLGYNIRKSELTALLEIPSHQSPTRRRSVSCGGLNQPPCSGCSSEVTFYWPFGFCCIPVHSSCVSAGPIRHCANGMSESGGTCKIFRANWQEQKIDPSRGMHQGINYWQYDDQVRDRLEMDTSKLNFVSVLDAANQALPQDGRYIYVYRKSDNKIVLRHYDRNLADKDFAYPGNCREQTDFGNFPCTTNGGQSGRSLHVRHSQLNGGWDPVWCAGEMRIENNKICLINNESGHFKPKPACTHNVRLTLKLWEVPTSGGLLSGDLGTFKAAQTCGSQHHDEL